jgi:hypothetical protein
MSTNQTHLIPFGQDTITAFERGEQLFVAVRPICDRLGLSFASQRAKLQTEPRRWGVSIIDTPSSAQGMLCLPKGKLFGWLNSIHPNKVAEKARPALLRYQAECDAVLDAYWSRRMGLKPDKLDLEFDMAGTKAIIEISTMMKLMVERMDRLEDRLETSLMDKQALVDFQSTTAFPVLRIEPRELEFAPVDLKRAKLRSAQRITAKDKRDVRMLHEAGFAVCDIGRAMNMSPNLVRFIKRALELHAHIAPDPALKRQRKQLLDNIAAKPRPRKTMEPLRFGDYRQTAFDLEGANNAA